jgi:hypothetical protein
MILQGAFRNGAHGVLKVLSDIPEHGDYQELRDTIKRPGRQIRKIAARPPRERRRSTTNQSAPPGEPQTDQSKENRA